MVNKILVSVRGELINEYRKEIESRTFPEAHFYFSDNEENALRYINQVSIILGQPHSVWKIINLAENLQWMQSVFAGVELMCKEGLKRDYVLTGIKDILGAQASEYVMGYVLAHHREIFMYKKNQSQNLWREKFYQSISRKTIGIAGLGSIGSSIAGRASAFGMNVLGLNNTKRNVQYVSKIFSSLEIKEFLQDLDYLVLCLPETYKTRNFLNKERFKLMKQNAAIINIGRGSLIDQGALINFLSENKDAHAVLDVFEHEPLEEENPLWKMPNVIITPHNAAFSLPKDVVDIFETNYNKYIEGKPLDYVVDFEKGY
jgi:phosphoglycerate dehydrogenase-like enzyme